MDKSEVNNNTQRPQDELPYEIRMQYIIKDYRKLFKKVSQLEKYSEGLEEENVRLKEQLEQLTPEREKILEEKLKEITTKNENLKCQVKNLIRNIEETYPKRKVKLTKYIEVVNGQKAYIENLQRILDEHGIKYYTMEFDYSFEENT